jgi:hypothetical protein
MKIMPSIWRILWKVPIVALAVVIGSMAASQAGWSGAELVLNAPSIGIGTFTTNLLFSVGVAITVGTGVLVQRIAKPILWVMVPILVYCAAVLGAWNGVVSDFDATRGAAIKHRYANAYALEHMSERGRFLSCQDARIQLTEDAKAVCTHALNVAPGQRIPGSDHRCGLLGMFSCFSTAPDNKQSNP